MVKTKKPKNVYCTICNLFLETVYNYTDMMEHDKIWHKKNSIDYFKSGFLS